MYAYMHTHTEEPLRYLPPGPPSFEDSRIPIAEVFVEAQRDLESRGFGSDPKVGPNLWGSLLRRCRDAQPCFRCIYGLYSELQSGCDFKVLP